LGQPDPSGGNWANTARLKLELCTAHIELDAAKEHTPQLCVNAVPTDARTTANGALPCAGACICCEILTQASNMHDYTGAWRCSRPHWGTTHQVHAANCRLHSCALYGCYNAVVCQCGWSPAMAKFAICAPANHQATIWAWGYRPCKCWLVCNL
jgi:hypothetical protein